MQLQEKTIFHPISLEDREWMNQRLGEENAQACEYTFANNFIWRNVYRVEVAEIEGCGVIRFQEEGHCVYSFPFGKGDKYKVIEQLRRDCEKKNDVLCMSPLVEEQRKWLLEAFPGTFEIDGDRDDYDYIYTTEKLSYLKGKKLHGKRNHIARFKDADDWTYEVLTDANKAACREMAKRWITMRQEKWNEEMDTEMHVLEEALSNMEVLGLTGGVLRKAGGIVAFTIGEPLNSNTFDVHFEKAYPDLQGAYPMINQQFVLHACQEFAYVNREEDTGDLGLRKAKLSYYPDILLKKYVARESHVVFASERDLDAVAQIWKTCFGDEEEYIQFYFEHRFQEDNMFVIFADGKPVSMASFLPTEILVGGEYRPAKYVYAVATLPEYRNRGYATEIIKHASEKYKEPLILQPAEETLIEYYRKMGFEETFPAYSDDREVPVPRNAIVLQECEKNPEGKTLAGWKFESTTPEEYQSIRDAHFEKEGYVRWDTDAIRYAIYENNFCRGAAVKLVPQEETENWIAENEEEQHGGREEVMLYREEEDALVVLECSLAPRETEKVTQALASELHLNKVRIDNKGGMTLLPDDILQQRTISDGYLNLTLG